MQDRREHGGDGRTKRKEKHEPGKRTSVYRLASGTMEAGRMPPTEPYCCAPVGQREAAALDNGDDGAPEAAEGSSCS